MSEPITLTERERAVFAHMACTLGNGTASHDIIVSNALLHFLDADFRTRSAELASPPRVPTEAEYTTAREQDRAEGYRAGIEAAARVKVLTEALMRLVKAHQVRIFVARNPNVDTSALTAARAALKEPANG